MKNVLRTIMILLWFFLGLYLGVGGFQKSQLDIEKARLLSRTSGDGTGPVSIHGETFADLQKARLVEEYDRAQAIFGWLYKLPDFAVFWIAAGAWGALGSIARLLKEMAIDKKPISEISVVAFPAFAVVVAVLLAAFFDVLPQVLTTTQFGQSEAKLRPTSILLICLFGGLVAENVYEWIVYHIRTIWKTPASEVNAANPAKV